MMSESLGELSPLYGGFNVIASLMNALHNFHNDFDFFFKQSDTFINTHQLAISVDDLQAFAGGKKDDLDMEGLLNLVRNLTDEQASEMKRQGLSLQSCVQQKGDLLFLPVGWGTCERAINRSVHYGVRKSSLPKGAADAYAKMVDTVKKTPGRSAAVYEQVLDVMRTAAADGQALAAAPAEALQDASPEVAAAVAAGS